MTTLLITLVSFAIALVVGSIVTRVHFTTQTLKNSLSRAAHEEILKKHRHAYKKQLSTLHNQARQKVTRLSQKVEEKDQEIVRLLSNACEQDSTQNNKVDSSARKLVKILREEAVKLRESLENHRARVSELNAELRESQTQAQQYLKDLNVWKQRVEPLTQKLREQQTTINTLRANHESESESKSKLAVQPAAISLGKDGSNGGQAADPGPTDIQADFQTDLQIDDLKAIRGIGPALEQRLNSYGIHRFHQIANMSEQELADVASKLAISPAIGERGEWIRQARALQQDIA